MTKEEIKQSVSMREIAERYGLRINRAGFCKCPFHLDGNERTASMKIYDDSFYCYGCQKSGDIFTFVQDFEKCDFKTAFSILGGTYDGNHKMANLRQFRTKKAKETKQYKTDKLRRQTDRIYDDLHHCLRCVRILPPFSTYWCECIDKIEYLRWKAEILEKEWKEINNGSSGRI